MKGRPLFFDTPVSQADYFLKELALGEYNMPVLGMLLGQRYYPFALLLLLKLN